VLLTAAECRAHCRVDDAGEEAYLLALAAAAQQHVEQITSRPLTSRAMVASAESWDEFRLVVAPVSAVGVITYTDTTGAAATLASSQYVVRTNLGLSSIRFKEGIAPPDLGTDPLINIALTAGYAAGLCPPDLKQACLLLVGHWYKNRELAVAGTVAEEVQAALRALISPRRVWMLA